MALFGVSPILSIREERSDDYELQKLLRNPVPDLVEALDQSILDEIQLPTKPDVSDLFGAISYLLSRMGGDVAWDITMEVQRMPIEKCASPPPRSAFYPSCSSSDLSGGAATVPPPGSPSGVIGAPCLPAPGPSPNKRLQRT